MHIESVRLFRRLGGGRYKQKKCSVLCCKEIDACITSNDVSKIKVCLECAVRAYVRFVHCSNSTATITRLTWG